MKTSGLLRSRSVLPHWQPPLRLWCRCRCFPWFVHCPSQWKVRLCNTRTVQHKKHCYGRQTARRAILVEILSTVAELQEQVVQQIHSNGVKALRSTCSKLCASSQYASIAIDVSYHIISYHMISEIYSAPITKRTWTMGALQESANKSSQQARPSTSFVDNTIDFPWQNFLSPEFGTKFYRDVPEFPYSTA